MGATGKPATRQLVEMDLFRVPRHHRDRLASEVYDALLERALLLVLLHDAVERPREVLEELLLLGVPEPEQAVEEAADGERRPVVLACRRAHPSLRGDPRPPLVWALSHLADPHRLEKLSRALVEPFAHLYSHGLYTHGAWALQV